MDEQTRHNLKEQLEREEVLQRSLYGCILTFNDIRVSMRCDPKEFPEAVTLADAAVQLLRRRACQQADRCTEIRRQLEQAGGGE